MSSALVEQLSTLIEDPATERARLGILLLEGHLGHLEPSQVDPALEKLNPTTRTALSGLVQRVKRKLLYHLGRTPRHASLLARPRVPESVAIRYPDHDLRGGLIEARDLLEEIVKQVLADLDAGKVTSPAPVWASLGSVGHPAIVGSIIKAYRNERMDPAMFRSLLGIDSPEARTFIEELSQSHGSARIYGLEGLWICGNHGMEILGQAARSEHVMERRAAAIALGRVPDPNAHIHLLALARDQDADVACVALDGLARTPQPSEDQDSEIVDLGESMTTPRTRGRWAHLLTLTGAPPHLACLKNLLSDPSHYVASQAALGLACFPRSSIDCVDGLLALTAIDDPQAQAAAHLALFSHRREHSEAGLGAMLGCDNRRERIESARIVRFTQTQELIEKLREIHVKETDYEVTQVQRHSLTLLDPRTPIDIIRPFLFHPSPVIRQTGVMLLESSFETQARVSLEELLSREEDFNVRQWGTRTLLRMVKREAPDQLKTVLNGKDSRIVASVVEDMGDLPSAEVVPCLLPLLGHQSNRVRASAILSLFRHGRFEGLEHLEQLLEDPGGPGYAAGIYALRQIGNCFWARELIRSPGLVLALSDRAEARSQPQKPGRLLIDLGELPSQVNIPITRGRRSRKTAAIPQVIDLTAAGKPQGTGTTPESELEEILPYLRTHEVESKLRHHLSRHPKHDAARYLLLKHLLSTGVDTGDLIGEFKGRSASGFINPYLEIGRFMKEVGRVPHAFTFYLRAFESKVLAIKNLITLAKKSLDRGRLSDANRSLEILGSLLPLDPALHPEIAEHYLSLKEYELAYTEFYRAHLAFPDNPIIALKLAAIAAKTRRRKLALQVLDNILTTQTEGNPIHERALRLRDKLANKSESETH